MSHSSGQYSTDLRCAPLACSAFGQHKDSVWSATNTSDMYTFALCFLSSMSTTDAFISSMTLHLYSESVHFQGRMKALQQHVRIDRSVHLLVDTPEVFAFAMCALRASWWHCCSTFVSTDRRVHTDWLLKNSFQKRKVLLSHFSFLETRCDA